MEVVEGRDPLLVLPAEVLHMVCSLLPAGDLARLSELSTGWREFARDESLWRGAGLRLRNTEVPLPPNHLRVLLRAPCLGVLDISDVQSVRYAKRLEEALRKLSKVRRLRWSCLTEAEVILPLLQRLAPHLEEMEVTELTETLEILDAVTLPAVRKVVINSHFDFIYPMDWEQAANQPSYLGVLEAMPALKSLRIHVDPGVMPTTPYLNFGLPPHLEELSLSAVSQEQLESILRMPALRTLRLDHDGSARVTARCEGPPAGHRGLRLLAVRIDQLHPDADACMLSLVRAHAAGLRELLIRNDDPDTRDRNKERFLVDKLRAYPFRELQKLTLERVWSHECGVECKAQIEELTHNLRHCGAKVCCTKPSFDTSDSSSEEDESD